MEGDTMADPSGLVTLKARFGDDTRRMEVERSIKWDQLSRKLASLYEVSSELAVRYCDTDGDLITVSSSEELHHMMTMMTGHDLIHVELRTRTTPSASPHPLRAETQQRATHTDARSTSPSVDVEATAAALEKLNLIDGSSKEQILQMLRDISLYITAREGAREASFIKHSSRKKNLITPRADARSVAGEEVLHTGRVQHWTCSHVSEWMHANNLEEYITMFVENEIDGEALLAMDHETLKSMGVGVAGKRVKILNTLKVLKMVISAPHVTECGGV